MVSQLLAAYHINIAGTSSHRKGKGQEALLVVEIDGRIPDHVIDAIRNLPPIYRVFRFPSLEGV
jgi:L-serine deaminase